MRPNRQTRRRKGKSDRTDAKAAARAVLSAEVAGSPKAGDDLVEMIRVLRVARGTAVKARTQAINALRSPRGRLLPSLRFDQRGGLTDEDSAAGREFLSARPS
jgi:transposase